MKAWIKTTLGVLLVLSILSLVGLYAANSNLTATRHVPLISYSIEYQMASTVLIEIDGRHTGSGFIVAPDLIVTAKHVVDRRGDCAVLFADGTKRNVQAIRVSEGTDCAVLLVHKANLRPLILTTKVEVGQPIIVIGSPLDEAYFNYITRGILSRTGVVEPWLSENFVFMIDAAVNPGNSGGPVFDEYGRVVGIVIAGYTYNCGMNFITPAADIIVLLEEWKDEGENHDGRYDTTEEEFAEEFESST